MTCTFEGVRLYALAGLIGAGCGLLSEIIQRPLRRDASWEDVFADSVGVLLALALYALVRPALRIPRRARARPRCSSWPAAPSSISRR